MRLALHLAADREQNFAVRQGFLQIGGPICHAAGPYAWSVDELRQRPGYRSGALREEDLAEGRRLLDASGYDPASVPPMTCSDLETPTAEVLHQNFAEIGFEVELQEQPDSENNPLRAAGEFTLTTRASGACSTPTPSTAPTTATADGTSASSRTEIDALLEQGRTTLAAEDRVAIYDEIQTKLLEEHNPRSTILGAGRSPDTVLAQGLRPNQHANRLHLSVVPVVVRGQAGV